MKKVKITITELRKSLSRFMVCLLFCVDGRDEDILFEIEREVLRGGECEAEVPQEVREASVSEFVEDDVVVCGVAESREDGWRDGGRRVGRGRGGGGRRGG